MGLSERADFQATSDPAVMEAADRGQSQLLSYEALYNLWERQQWSVQDLEGLRLLDRGDARVRDEGARPAAQGHRPDAGGLDAGT